MSNRNFPLTLAGLTVTGLLASALAGCGAVSTEASETEPPAAELAELTELLSTGTETCGKAAADKSYNQVFPTAEFIAPSSYLAGKNGCGAAYFVDVNDYRTGHGQTTNVIAWSAPEPSTKEACEATNVRVYVFEKLSNGSAKYVDWDISKGKWTEESSIFGPRGCATPIIYIETRRGPAEYNFDLTKGKNYKFAISARDIGPDPDVVKPFSISSRPIQFVR